MLDGVKYGYHKELIISIKIKLIELYIGFWS